MDLSDKIPQYLLGKNQLTTTVVFAVLFSIVSIFVSASYDANNWFEFGPTALFGYTTIFIVGGISILATSRMLMFRSRGLSGFLFWHYLLWCLAEIVLISLLYSAITLHLVSLGLLILPIHGLGPVFMHCFFIALLFLGIAYLISGLYFAVQDKENTIRLMNYGSVVSDSEPAPQDRQKVTLFGDDGLLKLSVSMKNLYYIESDDNYIKVWYSDSNGEIKQYMLRCRLKTVEESFSGSDLVRCHRKYIVNINKVQELSHEKGGYSLKLELPQSEPIPISKTYEEAVISRFNSR